MWFDWTIDVKATAVPWGPSEAGSHGRSLSKIAIRLGIISDKVREISLLIRPIMQALSFAARPGARVLYRPYRSQMPSEAAARVME